MLQPLETMIGVLLRKGFKYRVLARTYVRWHCHFTLRRLQGTQIETNIKQGAEERFSVFGLIDRADVIRETRDGRMQEIEITLSDWVFDAIENNHVLTLNRQYFQLRKPIPYKCSVMELNYKIRATCFNMPSLD